MSRSRVTILVLLLLGTLIGNDRDTAGSPKSPSISSPQVKRPNVLFLLSDNQHPDTVHRLGNPLIHTPNLDQLVDAGTSFTSAFTYYPLCVPSRAAILSGSTGFQNGVLPDYSQGFTPGLRFWPEVMQEAGYQTWYVGKWHSPGRPTTSGYSDALGLFASSGGRVEMPKIRDYRGQLATGYRGWVFQNEEGELFPEKGVGLTPHISADLADAAIEFIGRRPQKPFFLHVNFTAPHDPLFRIPGHSERYDPEAMPLPGNFMAMHPFDYGNFWGRDEHLLPWPRTPADVRRDRAVYYGVISDMDEQVGRILKALEESGQLENTIIIYSSDHGMAMGSHGIRGMHNMYEHTIRVPMIFTGPGIEKGQRTEAMVYLRELFPTVCDLLDIEIPEDIEGQSFAPLLKAGPSEYSGHQEIFAMFRNSQRMIRTPEWKLIDYPRLDHTQLFHLPSDPWELNNLAEDPDQQERLQELRRSLRRWQEEHDDPALLKN